MSALTPATRLLFGSAAVFNLAIGLGLLFARGVSVQLLGVAEPSGSNILLANLVGGFVALFGVGYALAARDPERWRPVIALSAWGKLVAFACILAAWLEGAIPARTVAPGAVDLAYAAAFFVHLARHKDQHHA